MTAAPQGESPQFPAPNLNLLRTGPDLPLFSGAAGDGGAHDVWGWGRHDLDPAAAAGDPTAVWLSGEPRLPSVDVLDGLSHTGVRERVADAWRAGRERVRTLSAYLGVAALSSIPVAHYAFEDPAFATAQRKLMPEGFTDPKGVAIGAGLLALMAAEGYLFGSLANRIPAISEKVRAIGEGSKKMWLKIGQTALEGVKKPIEWAAGGAQWVGGHVEAAGKWLESSSDRPSIQAAGRGVQAVASPIQDTAEVMLLGTPGAVVEEKHDAGQELPKRRIGRLAVLFTASWYPTYLAAKEVIYRGVYWPLDTLSKHNVPLARGADTGVHDGLKGFADVFDPSKVPGIVAYAAAAAIMIGLGVRAEYVRRHQQNGQTEDTGVAETAPTTAVVAPAQP